ncbi:MAG: glycosyltransferase, partial [Verrucomicrobiota bacterium]
VGPVLNAIQQSASVDRIQLVDDGSDDRTAEIGREAGVHVISLPERIPVGQAIMHHLQAIEGEALLVWCDADLIHLQGAYVDTLIQQYRVNNVAQSLSSRGLPSSWPSALRNQRLLQRAWAELFGPISGERVILKSHFEEAIGLAGQLHWIEMMRGYGIVLFLNWYCQTFQKGQVITYFDQLQQRQKYEKWGKHAYWEMVAQWVQFGKTWLKIQANSRRIRALRKGP